jgi:hypothetical protein
MSDQAAPAKGGEAVNAPLRQLIRDAVEQGFVSKGYEARSSAPADFWIGCRMSKEILGDKYSARAFEQYTEGTMVIYVVDPATRNWLWRGRVETRLNDANSPEIKRARLREAVERVMKSFPARGKPSATR